MKKNKRNRLSPVVRVTEEPYTKIAGQKFKTSSPEEVFQLFSPVTLIMQQNRLLENLDPVQIRQMLDSIGVRSSDSSKLSDDVLVQSVMSRRLQSPSDIRSYFENSLSNYLKGKQTLEAAFAELNKKPEETKSD